MGNYLAYITCDLLSPITSDKSLDLSPLHLCSWHVPMSCNYYCCLNPWYSLIKFIIPFCSQNKMHKLDSHPTIQHCGKYWSIDSLSKLSQNYYCIIAQWPPQSLDSGTHLFLSQEMTFPKRVISKSHALSLLVYTAKSFVVRKATKLKQWQPDSEEAHLLVPTSGGKGAE